MGWGGNWDGGVPMRGAWGFPEASLGVQQDWGHREDVSLGDREI